LGKSGNVLRFTAEDETGKRWEMMYFNGREEFDAYAAEKYGQRALERLYAGEGGGLSFDVVYYPGVNTWQGNTRLQLVMQQYR
ncbi:MAG: single-stranded-DNA-specific exonuclease RecJ, partial [Eubacteriales bacterium]|nr:single-stranded-DNA-specific exonuclease RecJ [Eubacteriales bacterium]